MNSNVKALSGSGDCSNISTLPEAQLPKISVGEINMDDVDQENQNDTNKSLVI